MFPPPHKYRESSRPDSPGWQKPALRSEATSHGLGLELQASVYRPMHSFQVLSNFCSYPNASLKQRFAHCCVQLLSVRIPALDRPTCRHFKICGKSGLVCLSFQHFATRKPKIAHHFELGRPQKCEKSFGVNLSVETLDSLHNCRSLSYLLNRGLSPGMVFA